jgi:hypothetical protein
VYVCVCVCMFESVTTLNSERKRARGDRYAPVCSRWLTKRLVKRLLTAAVTAAAVVGGRRPPIGRRSRPTVVDLRPPARKHARTHAHVQHNRIIAPRDRLCTGNRTDTTSQNDHTARAIASTASCTVNNVLSAASCTVRRLPAADRSCFCRVHLHPFTVSFSLSRGRPRRSPRKHT